MEFPEKIFCVKCGQELPGDAAFCSACGAVAHKPKTAPVAETVPLMEYSPCEQTAPLVQPPVFERTVSLVEEAPVKPYRFPVAALVFMGMTLMYFLFLFLRDAVIGLNIGNAFFDCTVYAVPVLGLIICKKPRNLLFGFGFLAIFLWKMIPILGHLSSPYYIRHNTLSYLMQVFCALSLSFIALGYLIKKRALKTVFAILFLFFGFILMICNLARYIEWGTTSYFVQSLFSFQFATLFPALAVFTYTPFKED